MDIDETKWLEHMQRLSLKPGDMLVLTAPGPISADHAERIKNMLEKLMEGHFGQRHKVLVLGDGMKLGVLENAT